jgi:hypothetical protein
MHAVCSVLTSMVIPCLVAYRSLLFFPLVGFCWGIAPTFEEVQYVMVFGYRTLPLAAPRAICGRSFEEEGFWSMMRSRNHINGERLIRYRKICTNSVTFIFYWILCQESGSCRGCGSCVTYARYSARKPGKCWHLTRKPSRRHYYVRQYCNKI